MSSILVIKHGAFGDIIQATGVFKAIRAHHPESHITVLTTNAFAPLFEQMPWFDRVLIDQRRPLYDFAALRKTIALLRARRYDWVYDLQTSTRSSLYWWLMKWPKPRWSGIARFASHRHNTPQRTHSHTLDRLTEQMVIAGVFPEQPDGIAIPAQAGVKIAGDKVSYAGIATKHSFSPDISWLTANINRFPLKPPYALLVPGGSPHRPEKRWPAERYAELANELISRGYQIVLIGGAAEAEVLSEIETLAFSAAGSMLNLCKQTSFAEIAEIARHAAMAIGNDTGPTHLIAATLCPTFALFATTASNPELCAPNGVHVHVIKKPSLSELKHKEVCTEIEPLLTSA